MYVHQERAFREFLVERKDIVVATGTGSGKTECFLVPMLGSLYDEANAHRNLRAAGVRALILYPMNALVNDQLSRLRLSAGRSGGRRRVQGAWRGPPFPSLRYVHGRTPYPGPRTTQRDGERVKPLLDYYLGLSPEVEAATSPAWPLPGQGPPGVLRPERGAPVGRTRAESALGRSTPTITGSDASTRGPTIVSC